MQRLSGWRWWRVLMPALLLLSVAHAEVPVPELKARVTDETGTLSASQKATLESRLKAVEQNKGSQVALLIVPTTDGESLEDFGIRVADAWKLGRASVDDGAIFIIAKDDHRMRIEVGYGLEGAIPDAIAKRIIEEQVSPNFRQGDYYAGISAGLDAIIARISGEALPPPAKPTRRQHQQSNDARLWLPVVLAVAIGFIVRSFVNAGAGMGAAAAIAGVSGVVMLGIGAGLVMAFFAVFLVGGGLGGGVRGLRRGGGWIGPGGGGFGGGRGGGGFRGGGGGFGGGGASGGW